MTAQAAIDEIVDRIAARFSPERIILFGSHARGDAREGSDLDLMVLFREVDDPRERAAELYEALIDCESADGYCGLDNGAIRAIQERREYGLFARRPRRQDCL